MHGKTTIKKIQNNDCLNLLEKVAVCEVGHTYARRKLALNYIMIFAKWIEMYLKQRIGNSRHYVSGPWNGSYESRNVWLQLSAEGKTLFWAKQCGWRKLIFVLIKSTVGRHSHNILAKSGRYFIWQPSFVIFLCICRPCGQSVEWATLHHKWDTRLRQLVVVR